MLDKSLCLLNESERCTGKQAVVDKSRSDGHKRLPIVLIKGMQRKKMVQEWSQDENSREMMIGEGVSKQTLMGNVKSKEWWRDRYSNQVFASVLKEKDKWVVVKERIPAARVDVCGTQLHSSGTFMPLPTMNQTKNKEEGGMRQQYEAKFNLQEPIAIGIHGSELRIVKVAYFSGVIKPGEGGIENVQTDITQQVSSLVVDGQLILPEGLAKSIRVFR